MTSERPSPRCSTWRAMARLMVAAAAWSCASAGVPPGGPEDFDAPKLVRVRPDTNARNVRSGSVTFDFDRVVSERPTGASDLAGLFLISPSVGRPSVSWRRTTIRVTPRGGFKPGTTYTVRMLTGLADLQNNVDSSGATVVFSTGPTLATGHLRGIVFDWLAEKSAPLAFVEAFPQPTPRDSARYVAVADSLGRVDLANVPPGRYLLRGSVDQNKNRIVDPRELYDTVSVTLTDSLRREVLAFVHDTIGAGIQSVALVDSLTLRVTMDRALDTAFVIDTSSFSLKGKDSTAVRIRQVLSRRAYDQLREDSVKTKAVQDSLQRAAKADSVRSTDSVKTAAPPSAASSRRAPPPRRTVREIVRAIAGRDTAAKEPPPKPSVPAPVTEMIVRLEAPLRPAFSYRLRAADMRTLLRRSRTSERVFTTPKEQKKGAPSSKDSTKARADSVARRDTTERSQHGATIDRGEARAQSSRTPPSRRASWTPFLDARRIGLRPTERR